MNQSHFTPEALDPVLSEFFRSRMRSPWPPAPVPASAVAEPVGIDRNPSSRPRAVSPGQANSASRARLTLFASVALLLGTGWYLSDSGPAVERATKRSGTGGGPNVLPDSIATTPAEFRPNQQDKAKKTQDPMTGFQPGSFRLP